MNVNIIRTLVMKDLRLFFRDRFFALITVLGLVFYIGIYFVMPADVDETLDLALYGESLPTAFDAATGEEGVSFMPMESEDALVAAVEDGAYTAGVVLPDTLAPAAGGERAAITVYFPPNTPEPLQDAVLSIVSGIGFGLSGAPLQVNITPEVIGLDLSGAQIPLRERMVPIFAVLILMMETLGLASLITEEVETRTIRAVLITPVAMSGLFVSKAIVGVGLAFTQAALLMLITGGLGTQPLLILALLLFGSVLVTGLGFLIASVARDMLTVIAWGVLALVVLIVPALTVLFPGSSSGWMQAIPSHYLIDAVDQVANFGAGWGDVWQNAVILLTFSAGFLVLGGLVLRRRLYES
jgi:ABC-2 type transport system permease protein